MDYEKKYKEANDKVAVRFGTNVAKEIFTDLYESEDERIRRAIIDIIKSQKEQQCHIDSTIYDEMIAWLEKQGEQTSAWSEEDERNLQGIIDEIEANKYSAPDYDLETYDRFLSWLKSLKDRVGCEMNCTTTKEWSEEDEKHIDSLLERLEGMCKKGATFTKTRFAISQDMDWFKSLKDRVQPQPKQEWSVEDESMIDNLIHIFEVNYPNEYYKALRKDMSEEHIPVIFSTDIITWLKSLKERIK